MTDYPITRSDPLSDILALVGVVSAPAVRFELGPTGVISFPGSLPIEYGSVIQGSCWLSLPGQSEPSRLVAGDCYMLNGEQPYMLQLDLGSRQTDSQAVDVSEFVARYRAPDGVVRSSAGSVTPTVLVCGGFKLQANADLLHGLLPACIHLSASPTTLPLLHAALNALAGETCAGDLGSRLVTGSLAQVVLVQMLRAYAASRPCRDGDWLGAFADERIGRSLQVMHGDPLRRWTLPELAGTAGMSRSGFALRFKTLVGTPPLDYLLRWRMRRAGQVLRSSDQTISSLALEYGYTSESAFSASFKRALGCSPRYYRTHPEEAPYVLGSGCRPRSGALGSV